MRLKILDQQSTGFIAYFLRAYPWESALLVFFLIGAGLAEGVGVLTLLPVLEVATGEASSGGGSVVSETILGSLDWLGLPSNLPILLTVVVFALFAKGIFRWLAMKRVGYTVAAVAADLRLKLIRALMEAEWAFFTSQPLGQFANAIGTEAHRAAVAYRQAVSTLAGVIQVVVYTAIVIVVSWKVAVFAAVVGVALTAAFGSLVRVSREAGGEKTTVMKSLIERLSDSLQGIKPIKAMARGEEVFPILERQTEQLKNAERRQVLASETLKSFQEPILALIIASGIYLAVTWGNESVSVLLLLAFLFYRIIGRFNLLQRQYQTMTTGESAFWSLHEGAGRASEAREPDSGTRAAPDLEQSVRFEDVHFGYDDKKVLRGASLSISAGEFVGLVGPSGAGKTTIVDLLTRLHEPSAGTIYVDHIPLQEIDLRSWRRRIGYVPQDTLLFHTSVAGNVALEENPDPDRVRQVLEDAGAWDFVRELPDGIETVIGEQGAKLSGGQRQRISLARALYKRPALLILDEATTGLDPATERQILASLDKVRGRVTIIAISHQTGLQAFVDSTYRVRNGQLERVEEDRSVELAEHRANG